MVMLLAAPALAADATPETITHITLYSPKFPEPMQTSILGLSLTAIAVIGARVSNRNSDTMMFMVLATLAVTAMMVVFSDKQYRAYHQTQRDVLKQLQSEPTGTP